MSENHSNDWNNPSDSSNSELTDNNDQAVAETTEDSTPKSQPKAKTKPVAKAKAKATPGVAKAKANPTITAAVANRVLSAHAEVETMDDHARMLLAAMLEVPEDNSTNITVGLVGGASTLSVTVEDINLLRAEDDAIERGYLWDSLGRDRSRNAWAAMFALTLVDTPKAPTSDVRAAFTAVNAIGTVDEEMATSLEQVALLCRTA